MIRWRDEKIIQTDGQGENCDARIEVSFTETQVA